MYLMISAWRRDYEGEVWGRGIADECFAGKSVAYLPDPANNPTRLMASPAADIG